VTCVFSALACAELASTLPVSGSAYTYAYATMGEVLAWIIGWDLILEYGVSVAAVAVGWGAYFVELMDSLFGVTISDSISLPPGEGGDVNVPAFLLVLAVAALLISGVRQSARSNTVMVILKLLVLLFFIVVAFSAFDGDHFSDFARMGSAASRPRLR
jgi:basic amino acid/polyamine antiporter, APA family